ncbi:MULTISPECIES: hypothetical protein [unclassified Bradyrhizobium]|uniref:hypothetical protein n=1 Tax=unclassified Bradyrhizobium TaxID=2631580 RepID=UPI002FF2910C
MPKPTKDWEKIDNGRRKRPVRTRASSSPSGKKRLRIKEAAKSRIRDIILDWDEPNFTWDLLLEKINKEFGGKWSAWAVGKHRELQEYFQITKDRIRKEKAERAGANDDDEICTLAPGSRPGMPAEITIGPLYESTSDVDDPRLVPTPAEKRRGRRADYVTVCRRQVERVREPGKLI